MEWIFRFTSFVEKQEIFGIFLTQKRWLIKGITHTFFLPKIQILVQKKYFYFWQKFRFFDQTFYFWWKFRFFDQYFHFWQKFRFFFWKFLGFCFWKIQSFVLQNFSKKRYFERKSEEIEMMANDRNFGKNPNSGTKI